MWTGYPITTSNNNTCLLDLEPKSDLTEDQSKAFQPKVYVVFLGSRQGYELIFLEL